MDSNTRITLIAALVPSLVLITCIVGFLCFFLCKRPKWIQGKHGQGLESGVEGGMESPRHLYISIPIPSPSFHYEKKTSAKSLAETNTTSRIWAQFMHVNRSNSSISGRCTYVYNELFIYNRLLRRGLCYRAGLVPNKEEAINTLLCISIAFFDIVCICIVLLHSLSLR